MVEQASEAQQSGKYIHNIKNRSDRISHKEIEDFRENINRPQNISVTDREAANFGDAIFLDQVHDLRFQPGQRVRVTDQDAELTGVKAVVMGDYNNLVLLGYKNKYGVDKKHTVLKVDIIRGYSGNMQRKGGWVKVELYSGS